MASFEDSTADGYSDTTPLHMLQQIQVKLIVPRLILLIEYLAV